MKICIMGAPVNCLNRGVMALGASLVELCLQANPDAEVVFLLGNRNNQPVPFRVAGEVRAIPVVNSRMSPKSRLRDHFFWILLMSLMYRLLPFARARAAIARYTPWIKAVAEAEIVGDIRGGDSFSDIYGMRRFLDGFLQAWTILMVRGTILQFPQTYGPYSRKLARWLARYILNHSSVIISRDRQSQKVAQELVGPRRKVLLSPDVAFCLESSCPDQIELDPPPSRPSPFTLHPSPALRPIGLNVNGLMYNGGFTRNNMFGLNLDYVAFLPVLVTALLRESPGELWLVPHTFAHPGWLESDPEACRKLRDALPSELRARVRIVTRAYDAYEIKGVIGRCDFFIASRMHSCIAALSQGIPCVGLAYSMKFAGVFESVGMEDWVVDGRLSASDEAVHRIIALYRQRNSVREELATRSEQARQQLFEIFNSLLNPGVANIEPMALADAISN